MCFPNQDTISTTCNASGEANFLTGGPQWVVKCDSGAGAAAGGWRVLLADLMGAKNIDDGKFRNVL